MISVPQITKKQAARFLLLRHGLLGRRQYAGKNGVRALFDTLGAIQYDPVSICGRSPELTIHARVAGYRPEMLWELLYKDRVLVDYFDKCMCILPAEDFKYFGRTRKRYAENGRSRAEIDRVIPQVLELAARQECISARDIGLRDKIDWPWGPTSVGRAAAERLYHEGRLVIHHKEGVVRWYTLPEKVGLEEQVKAPDPHPDDAGFYKWIVRRRLRSIGMMENRPGDGFLGLRGLTSPVRRAAFAALEGEGAILPLEVEGRRYYIDSRDRPVLEAACASGLRVPPRCELLAPLDNLLWDRRLAADIFGFQYKWEIYVPESDRKYGAYVLPVLYRDALVGRAEPVADAKSGVLTLQRFWPEPGFRDSPAFRGAFEGALRRLARLNGCRQVEILK
ncbi:MAG: crosslink repair DNA glycosylase YcaQ family protein [Clostridia bacterium]|nr:crosslink repair DNA glycosylase YcaQ family protein [Clostridia bacterium]